MGIESLFFVGEVPCSGEEACAGALRARLDTIQAEEEEGAGVGGWKGHKGCALGGDRGEVLRGGEALTLSSFR